MQGIINGFVFNELNLLFGLLGLLITGLSILTIPGQGQITVKRKEFYLLCLFFIISFLVVIFSRYWLVFIIFWEMVTVSIALMLLWKNRGLAGQYLIVQFLGSSFLIFFILLAIKNGYQEIGPIREVWLQNLFILGLGMKSAIFGLHFWLPPIHTQAPATVSAILSGWVVKLGFIIYLKIITEGNDFLLTLGLLMVFYGGVKALKASDYKVLLAYSSISQLGYIAIGIGSGTIYGYLGSILHIIAHSLSKASLFIGSGYLIKEYGSRHIYDFKDLWKRQKLITLSMLVSFSSLMGFPLVVGYRSRHLLKYSFKNEYFILILLYGASLLTVSYCFRLLYWGIFRDILDERRKKNSVQQTCGLPGDGRKCRLKKADYLTILIAVVLILIIGSYSETILMIFGTTKLSYSPLRGLLEFVVFLLISLIILKKAAWFKINDNEIPSLDGLFNRVNKGLYSSARYLYNWIYQDFQYQLLWIPVFLSLLLLLINIRF